MTFVRASANSSNTARRTSRRQTTEQTRASWIPITSSSNSMSPNHSMGLIQRLWARAPLAWFLLGAFSFVYLQVFILPFIPISFWADQSTYLLNARRMLDGQVMYR